MTSSILFDRLKAAAAAGGPTIAIRDGDRSLSYADLVEAAELCASQLLAAGLPRSGTVAALSHNRLEVLVVYYAAASLDAVFVPINPVLTASEVAYIVTDSRTNLLLHESEFSCVAEAAVPDSQQRWTFERLASLGAPRRDLATRPPTPDAGFLTIYTSGSTGKPKAVVYDQLGEINGNAGLIDMWGITSSDVIVVGLPLGFLYGLSTAASAGLQAGAQIVLVRKFHPRDVLNALVESKATIYHGVPTMFAMMLDYAEKEGLEIDLGEMRLLISAGAPLSEELRARFTRHFNKRIDDYYALTEARPILGRRFDDPQIPPKGAVGKLAPRVEIHVVAEDERLVGVREIGEIVVRAPGMFRRYASDAEAAKPAVSPLGFHTGDVGYYDEEGYYYITGRIKDIIIRGGANIAPAEVEEVLSSHPSIQLAAVVGMPDRTLGEVAVAFVTLREGAKVTSEALIEHCRAGLASFKVPAIVRIVRSMPIGSTDKIDKKVLKAEARELAPSGWMPEGPARSGGVSPASE